MAAEASALVRPTANAVLEDALRARLQRRRAWGESFGQLEKIAFQLGLVQNSSSPSFSSARLIVFAADHGLAVDDLGAAERRSTAATVSALLDGSLPLGALARSQGLDLTVVDSGVAESLKPNPRLMARKIAHGTRNSRVGVAMSTEQAHAAMRAGMEIGDSLGGSAVACSGIGVGSAQSAALVLSCLSGVPLIEFIDSVAGMNEALRMHLLRVLEEARGRHGHLDDPVELVAAVGGFEVAMMTGLMLAAASRRRLLIVDGIPACAALMVASEIAPAISDYCVFARSTPLRALTHALELFGGRALVDIGLDSVDGTGAALAWALVSAAGALLSDSTEPVVQSAPGRAPTGAAQMPESQG